METLPLPGTGQLDDNRGPEILGTCGALVGVSFLFLGIRFFVRVRMTKEVAWDDWFCLFSWITVFIEMMLFIPEVKYGAGRHVAYIDPPSNIPKGLKINFFTQPLSIIAVTLVKISIGLFLLRITPSVFYGRLIKGFIAFTSLSCAAHIPVIFLQCRPLPYIWGEGEGSCMPGPNLRFASFFNSAIGVLTDFMFALIPIPMFYNLQVNWRVKIAVCGILALGLFATSAAFVKIYHMSNYGLYRDFLYDSTDLTIWTTVETCVGIVAACFPCLRPIFKAALSSSFLSNPNNSRSEYSGQNPRTGRNDNKEGFQMYGNFESGELTTIELDINGGNGSEESILRQSVQKVARESGIVKTTQVTIDYGEGYRPNNEFRV